MKSTMHSCSRYLTVKENADGSPRLRRFGIPPGIAGQSTRVVVILLMALVSGCVDKTGIEFNPILVYTPSFIYATSKSALNRLLRDPESLDVKLNRGMDPNLMSSDGTPLLTSSIAQAQHKSFAVLLKHGADPIRPDKKKHNAWFYALTSPSSNYLETLRISSNKLQLSYPAEAVAILQLAKGRNLLADRLPFMLNWPIDWNAPDAKGVLPIEVTLQTENESLVSRLMDSGADPKKIHYPALAPFVAPGKEEYLEFLLQSGVNPNAMDKEGRTLLFAAISQENIKAVELLFLYEADPRFGSEQNPPLLLALFKGKTGIALEMLHRGLDPNVKHGAYSAVDAAELMLDSRFLDALHTVPPSAGTLVPEELAQALIARGVHISGERIWEPRVSEQVKKLQRNLGLPAHGHPSSSLLAAVKAHQQLSELITASQWGRIKTIEEIVKQRPSILQNNDKNGWTALMHASFDGQKMAVQKLLDLGSKIDTKDDSGSNSLLIAVVTQKATPEQKLATVNLLVARGAISERNNDGLTALQAAEKIGPQLAAVNRPGFCGGSNP